jgi:uncharacterized membrane protein YraQ (UPF0718 family)
MKKKIIIIIKKSFFKSFKNIVNFLPMMISVVLLLALAKSLVPKSFYLKIFSQQNWKDSVIGALLGSIMAGNPSTSYIMGGEFLKEGVSLIAVTSFILTWVTVGLFHLPAEISQLGKKFALVRLSLSFASAILIAFITVYIYQTL